MLQTIFMAFLGISKCANTSRKSNQSQSNLSSRNSYFYNKRKYFDFLPFARKNAFIEIGNLMAFFQRMTDTRTQIEAKQLPQVYKLAVLNHSLLSSLASLGTYIQSHKTTTVSEAFNVVVDTAIKKLDNAIFF
jgi:hypothetical protein